MTVTLGGSLPLFISDGDPLQRHARASLILSWSIEDAKQKFPWLPVVMDYMDVIEDSENSLPLSAAQLGLWFAQKIDPTNPIYNLGQSIEIHGPVDPSLFKAAVKQGRHRYRSSPGAFH